MSKVKKGAAASYLYILVHLVTSVLYAPILIHFLGDTEYGLYQLIGSIFGYLSIFEESLSAGVLKYYCQQMAAGDPEKTENVLGIGRRIFRWLSLLTAGAGVVITLLFRAFYAGSFSPSEIRSGSVMLLLLFASLVLTMLNSVYFAGLQAQEEFFFLKMLDVLREILQLISCITVLMALPYTVVVILIRVLVTVLILMLRFIRTRKEGIRAVFHAEDKLLARQILTFSLSILAGLIADQIFWKADQLILGKYYGTGVVAVYSIGSLIYTGYMYSAIPIAQVFFPRISFMRSENRPMKEVSDLFIRVGRIGFFLAFLVLSGFVLLGRDLIALWVGARYEKAYAVALIVMIPFTVDIIQNLGLSILQVYDRYAFRAKMYLVAAILNVGSTAVMAKIWGMEGAALSTGLTMAVTSGVIMNVYYARTGLDIPRFWRNILLILLTMLPVPVLFALFLQIMRTDSWLRLALMVLVYMTVFCLYGYAVVADPNEKDQIWKILRKLGKGESA